HSVRADRVVRGAAAVRQRLRAAGQDVWPGSAAPWSLDRQIGVRVNTVLGPVSPDDLGVTLTHEHIFIDLRFDGTGVDGVLDDVDLAIDELRRFKDAGGGTVVDVTNKYLGRNGAGLMRVARAT